MSLSQLPEIEFSLSKSLCEDFEKFINVANERILYYRIRYRLKYSNEDEVKKDQKKFEELTYAPQYPFLQFSSLKYLNFQHFQMDFLN